MWAFIEEKSQQLFQVLAPELTPTEQFFVAIEKGDMNYVQNQVNTGGLQSVDSMVNAAGNRPIHVAAYYGQESMVHYLISLGADIHAIGARGNSCLHYAAMKGNNALVDYFLQQGLSPCARNAQGKNVYDVAEGFSLKQKLMPLIFAEEERTGTAPTIIGATRDLSKDQERLAGLPPPPTVGGIPGLGIPPQQNNIINSPYVPITNAGSLQPGTGGGTPPASPMYSTNSTPMYDQYQQQQQQQQPYQTTSYHQPSYHSVPAPPPPPPPPPHQQQQIQPQQMYQPSNQQIPVYQPRIFSQAQASRATTTTSTRKVESDGFITTASDPALAQRYGNLVGQNRMTPPVATPPPFAASATPSSFSPTPPPYGLQQQQQQQQQQQLPIRPASVSSSSLPPLQYGQYQQQTPR